jgi:hypothetical protein
MVELGKIEKPKPESYAGKKKLYCVQNMYLPENAPDEYKRLFHKYWDEVSQQIEKIEVAGKIKKVFCESIYSSREEALDTLGRMNERAVQIIKKKLEEDGTLLPLENKEIFGPFLDWSNCLMMVKTKEVFDKVQEFYMEFLNKRFQHILNVIENNLTEGEAGLLIMRNEDRARIQFPSDIEIFLVIPPSHDNLLKWLREQLKDREKEKNSKEPRGKSET